MDIRDRADESERVNCHGNQCCWRYVAMAATCFEVIVLRRTEDGAT